MASDVDGTPITTATLPASMACSSSSIPGIACMTSLGEIIVRLSWAWVKSAAADHRATWSAERRNPSFGLAPVMDRLRAGASGSARTVVGRAITSP